MNTYRFTDGHTINSKLSKEEVLKRMNRLDILRVMTEGYEEGEGYNICQKALRAYNKTDPFTGIIRLNILEKDFLSYCLEDEFIDDEEREIVNFYIR